MTTFLLDASVWVCASDPADRFHGPARALVFDFDRRLAAMDLTLYEVANALGVRRAEPREARYVTEMIVKRCSPGELVAADPELLDLATVFAHDHGLTAYDAAYVAVARSRGWTLVSADIADLVSKGLAVAPDDADYP
ncbi:MAG TPA: PIN domain-containing protein [Solirubrobacterales bacterium]